MLSDLIKQLQTIYEKHGDMPLVAGHTDKGVEYSWGDEIDFEYLRHFTKVSPIKTVMQTKPFKDETGIHEGIESILINDIEEFTLHHEGLSCSSQEPKEKEVLFLHLDNVTLPC